MTAMPKTKLKIYFDSTVPNYIFNDEYPEKQKAAKALFAFSNKKEILTFVSSVTLEEIKAANEPKRSEMLKVLRDSILLQESSEAEELAKTYIKKQIFSKSNREDARHTAYAVYYGVNILASYNFSHIVRLSTINKLRAENLILGYQTPEIRSPEEIDL